jgi:hypothetical protein
MNKRVVEAQAAAAQAREELISNARELQQRLQPKTLVRDAWEGAKVKGTGIADEAVDTVKRRPAVAGGAVAAIALFIARGPIKNGVRRLFKKKPPAEGPVRPIPMIAPLAPKSRAPKQSARRVSRNTESE